MPEQRDLINDWPSWAVGVTYRDYDLVKGTNGIIHKVFFEWTEEPFFVHAKSQDEAVETISTLAAWQGVTVVKIVLAKVNPEKEGKS